MRHSHPFAMSMCSATEPSSTPSRVKVGNFMPDGISVGSYLTHKTRKSTNEFTRSRLATCTQVFVCDEREIYRNSCSVMPYVVCAMKLTEITNIQTPSELCAPASDTTTRAPRTIWNPMEWFEKMRTAVRKDVEFFSLSCCSPAARIISLVFISFSGIPCAREPNIEKPKRLRSGTFKQQILVLAETEWNK